MSTKAKEWLAQYHNVTLQDIDNLLKDEKATSYLLVWSIFEQDIFNGFMKINDIKKVSEEFAKFYQNLDVDNIAKKFHLRYQNKDNYRHLIHKQDNTDFKTIIQKTFANLSTNEKLEMLFFVAYRYRNNIFHGNKKVLSWAKYTEQIKDCIIFITSIIDLNKKEQIIKEK